MTDEKNIKVKAATWEKLILLKLNLKLKNMDQVVKVLIKNYREDGK